MDAHKYSPGCTRPKAAKKVENHKINELKLNREVKRQLLKEIETFYFATERLVICLFYLLIYEVVVTKVESVFFLIFQI